MPTVFFRAMVSWKGMYFALALFLGSFFGSIFMLGPFLPLMFISPAWYRWITDCIVATWLTLPVVSGTSSRSGQLSIIPQFSLLTNTLDFILVFLKLFMLLSKQALTHYLWRLWFTVLWTLSLFTVPLFFHSLIYRSANVVCSFKLEKVFFWHLHPVSVRCREELVKL